MVVLLREALENGIEPFFLNSIWCTDPELLAPELDELPLPWMSDVRAYEIIRNPASLEHIQRVGIEIGQS